MSAWRIIEGDALECLAVLEPESVQTCITSPPYWGLRDYGVDGQLGLESTPEEYVEAVVSVFRAVRRVLRDDGTVWLNLGDSYAGGGRGGGGSYDSERAGWDFRPDGFNDGRANRGSRGGGRSVPGLKPKDLVGIPWRVAFALQADGWYLRSDIIWAKPNPMPESVTDRPTKSHEYLFLLSKSARYYYDADAVAEPVLASSASRYRYDFHDIRTGTVGKLRDGRQLCVGEKGGAPKRQVGLKDKRNRRTVWTIPTQPFPGAHFAVFPPALVEPCVLAGSSTGDLVLDPFAGSGTVGVVCRKHQRRFVGIELNPEYARMARGRLGGNVVEDSPEEDAPLFNRGDAA